MADSGSSFCAVGREVASGRIRHAIGMLLDVLAQHSDDRPAPPNAVGDWLNDTALVNRSRNVNVYYGPQLPFIAGKLEVCGPRVVTRGFRE